MAACDAFHRTYPTLPIPNDVVAGAVWVEQGAPPQCAHCDQMLCDENASQKWQGLITGASGCNFLVYTRTGAGTLLEVCVEVPPHHMLAFGGRVWHAGAENTGLNT
jgi:hypothetical protein